MEIIHPEELPLFSAGKEEASTCGYKANIGKHTEEIIVSILDIQFLWNIFSKVVMFLGLVALFVSQGD